MSQLPILILPGTLCTGAMFTHQVNHLAALCDNINVVQFTTEKTLVEMAEKVIVAANNKPCALIGFSMGGIVAIALAKTRPDLIAKLALVNSNCHGDLPERKAPRAAQIKQARSGAFTDLITKTFLPNYLYTTNSEHEKTIVDMAETLGAHCFEAQALALEDRDDSLSTLEKLDVEVLIIGGMQDKICPAKHQKIMHDALKHSELALLEECGHFSPLEQAEQVSALLAKWYSSPLL